MQHGASPSISPAAVHRGRTPLFAALSLLGCAVVPEAACATTWPVGRCSDMVGKGGDTLRVAISKAGSNDTVDLSTLAVSCSTITLTGGAIPVPQAFLNIVGPSDRALTINAATASRAFVHAGTGRLVFNHLTIANGSATPPAIASGGCIYSNGTIQLDYSALSNCSAYARGGALYAKGGVQLRQSSITGSTVHQSYAIGGAVFANSVLVLQGSAISGNHSDGYVGGIYSTDDGRAYDSSISGNTAALNYYGEGYPRCGAFGATGAMKLIRTMIESNTSGVCANGSVTLVSSSVSGNAGTGIASVTSAAATISVYDSTISENAGYGISSDKVKVHVYNTTIAHNVHGGVNASNCTLTFVSSILFGNGANTLSGDLNTHPCTQSGSAYNIIGVTTLALPLTVAGNPRLTPLAYRGGPTRTHGLSINSPAIDAGSNPKASPYDQRYTGFARVAGARADIGAFERQVGDDELFYGGFE